MAAPRAPPEFKLLPAAVSDAPELFTLVNRAYEVETGNDGPAFKKCGRYDDVQEVEQLIVNESVVKAVDTVTGRIIAMISYVVTSGVDLYFGPFAVDTGFQGRGVGRALLEHVEDVARGASCRHLKITVVDCRSDIIPMYEGMGFVEVAKEPFPHPWKCNRPVGFLVMLRQLH